MRSFMNLVVNEWLKMFKKRSFFIPFAVIFGMIVIMLVVVKYFGSSDETISGLALATSVVSDNGMGRILLYLIIIATAGTVAKEHSLGTIKLLLIRAQSRSKILASKYVMVLLYTLLIYAFAIVISLISGGLMFGLQDPNTSWSDLFQDLLYRVIYSIIYVTITFMVGILTRSSGATIGVGMLLTMLESLIVALLSKYQFTKYLIFANTNLSVYKDGHPPVAGMTMTFSLVVIAVYMILFLSASFVTFNKRDVA
ncbi:DUF2705 family protein [Paenibacillus puldeungensis]|uniref:DUF2705 family protein n=2 Tax=Paenibacillus puldeungensis TaxID=696536 RepID=A0ABW3RQM4_9BACL